MATSPWLALLITVIGAPLLGALLYFLVPLGIWLTNPPWWVQNIFAALLVGGIVAMVSILWQESISDNQATQATRLENLRFVRQLSSQKDVTARPFSDLDLQGQNLARLDLRGADLDGANLQHANLDSADLSPAPSRRTDLAGANLTGANLTDANLTDAFLLLAHLDGADLTSAHLDGAHLRGADLTSADLGDATLTGARLYGANLTGADLTDADLKGVHYDEKTKWPVGFKPPPPAPTP
jgi:uncharacterized protein YjbI with pentapeptide repeats